MAAISSLFVWRAELEAQQGLSHFVSKKKNKISVCLNMGELKQFEKKMFLLNITFKQIN